MNSKLLYDESSLSWSLGVEVSQAVVGVITAVVFLLMALEWVAPEVLLFSALVLTLLLRIISLAEALSGIEQPQINNSTDSTVNTYFQMI
jgi:hypothetical protein